MKKLSICLLLVLAAAFNLYSQDAPNPTINTAIRKHGLEKSKVMDIASWVCDVYGPRLTGSPMLDKATDWAQKSLKEWGMSNVHLEAWGPFGRGWEFNHFAMHATAPNYFPIIGYPKAWSPSTKGVVSGEVIYLKADDEEDLKAFKGKLKGKFVFLDTIRTVKEPFEAPAARLNAQELLDMANSPAPARRPDRDYNRLGGLTFNQKLFKFIADEEPLAVIDRGFKGDLGTVFVTGARAVEGRVQDAAAKVIPQATISVEHYNRIFRLMQKGIPVTLSMDLKANYTNPDGMEHNIIAEIPGTDLKDEIVMLGAHFDSWHAGTGATDNGAGSSVMMKRYGFCSKRSRKPASSPAVQSVWHCGRVKNKACWAPEVTSKITLPMPALMAPSKASKRVSKVKFQGISTSTMELEKYAGYSCKATLRYLRFSAPGWIRSKTWALLP